MHNCRQIEWIVILMIRCEGWESPCVDTASERGEGGLEWDRRAQNFQFFHDYHDHRVGAKALLWHDNKVLTLNLLLGSTMAFHSLHDGNDDSLIRAHLIFSFFFSTGAFALIWWSVVPGGRGESQWCNRTLFRCSHFFLILIFFLYNFFNFKI